jgi:hypothetical protein
MMHPGSTIGASSVSPRNIRHEVGSWHNAAVPAGSLSTDCEVESRRLGHAAQVAHSVASIDLVTAGSASSLAYLLYSRLRPLQKSFSAGNIGSAAAA